MFNLRNNEGLGPRGFGFGSELGMCCVLRLVIEREREYVNVGKIPSKPIFFLCLLVKLIK